MASYWFFVERDGPVLLHVVVADEKRLLGGVGRSFEFQEKFGVSRSATFENGPFGTGATEVSRFAQQRGEVRCKKGRDCGDGGKQRCEMTVRFLHPLQSDCSEPERTVPRYS